MIEKNTLCSRVDEGTFLSLDSVFLNGVPRVVKANQFFSTSSIGHCRYHSCSPLIRFLFLPFLEVGQQTLQLSSHPSRSSHTGRIAYKFDESYFLPDSMFSSSLKRSRLPVVSPARSAFTE